MDLEYNEEFAILHLPFVEKFNRETYEDIMLNFPRLKVFLADMGYANIWAATAPLDKPTGKLLERLGFNKAGESHGMDVYLLADIEGES